VALTSSGQTTPPAACGGEAFPSEPFEGAARLLVAELSCALPKVERIDAACEALRTCRSDWLLAGARERFVQLALALRRAVGPPALSVARLLEEVIGCLPRPWQVLDALFAAQAPPVPARALDVALAAARAGSLVVDGAVVQALAELVDQQDSDFARAAPLAVIRSIVDLAAFERLSWFLGPTTSPGTAAPADSPSLSTRSLQDPRLPLLGEGPTPAVRRLAARLLDLDAPPSDDITRRLLGEDAWQMLGRYLAFTRATHLDLLEALTLVEMPGALESFRNAESVCGEAVLREVIARVGWRRLAVGIDAQKYFGISIAGSFPLMLRPSEVALFDGWPEARRVFERTLVVAHGGRPGDRRPSAGADDAITRFRAYNVMHADLLADILDPAPLRRDRLHAIMQKLDRVVADFAALFRASAPEADSIADISADLKDRILRGLAATDADHLPIEICRLALTFEDPAGPGDIHTLHGLKRYLHQRGLKLAFALVEPGSKTPRTIDLLVSASPRGPEVAGRIEFVDLEAPPGTTREIPYPVEMLVEAFGRQLLAGHRRLPDVRVFCYGNEVHYFVSFRNHPAFIRVDFSPPLRGGMIDLQYLGVSNYELTWHPRATLDAIRLFFERLDFTVNLDATSIHARYDKERALEPADLLERARMLFHLVPHLMDLDWAIGSLALDDEGKRVVSAAWADFWMRWGVLPVDQVVTKDRAGILVALETGAEGVREVRWSGNPPYRDVFCAPAPPDLARRLSDSVAPLGLGLAPPSAPAIPGLLGQLPLEAMMLRPLRAALHRGEVADRPEGLTRQRPACFQRVHEVERLTDILESDDATIARSAQLAALAAVVERNARFQTSGSINGYIVQRARLDLGVDAMGLFVLRDDGGIPRLAVASDDEILCRRRDDSAGPWRDNATCDVDVVSRRLRAANYLASGPDPPNDDEAAVAGRTRGLFRAPRRAIEPRPFPGEHLIAGIVASPGRTSGIARLGTAGREPHECVGAILVAPRLDPGDAPFLFHAAAVVSAGGGILSHLALTAVESRKPALVAPGVCRELDNGQIVQSCQRLEYEECERTWRGYHLVERHHVREVQEWIRDGDLLVVDADRGTLTLLGQDRLTLALHEALRLHADAGRRLSAGDEVDVLVERGRWLRARHQIEKLVARIAGPALARYGVEEILLGGAAGGVGDGDQAALLALLLGSARVGSFARTAVLHVADAVEGRLATAHRHALALIPDAATAHDVLALRLNAVRLHSTLRRVEDVVARSGVELPLRAGAAEHELDALALQRLAALRALMATRALQADAPFADRLLRELARLDGLLDGQGSDGDGIDSARLGLAERSRAALARLADCRVVTPRDGGLELQPLVGGKAATLAETERLLGPGFVPGWFAITDRAFQDALDSPTESDGAAAATSEASQTVREAIQGILARTDRTAAWKASAIRAVWERAGMPDALAAEITREYRALDHADETPAPEGASGTCPVAVRSSALEEDTERATKAGQFETFLFIRGDQSVLDHVRLAWSGLWTERAIHDRASRGDEAFPRGGVIVQRMVNCSVSGVLQSINAAANRPQEMVINVGLGLGEGVVSGTVAADHVAVDKATAEGVPLRFRYLTSEKREYVVCDERFGQGTVRVATPAHRRLRPALEYPELRALVDIAMRLEGACGHPIDIEFGFEDGRLRVLQLRPVASAFTVWRDTASQAPFKEVVR